MIYLHTQNKPAAWAVAHGMADPRHLDLWRSCVLAWPFWSIGEAKVEDAGPNKLHGLLGSNILPASDWVGSPYGAALKFTGQTNDKVAVADPSMNLLDGTSKLSLEVLFKPAAVGAAGVNYGLLNKYRPSTGLRSWRLQLDGPELSFQVSNDGAGNEEQKTTNASLAAGSWYRTIVVYDAGVFKVWLNGKALTTDGDFGTHTSIFAGGEELKVGQRTDSAGNANTPIQADIASVRIWLGRALSVQDVALLEEAFWAMYQPPVFHPSLAVLHEGAAAPGPWMEYGEVAKGVQELLLQGLMNGTSYDVQIKTVDLSGNVSAGDAVAAATPVAGAKPWMGRLRRRLRLATAGIPRRRRR